MIKPMGTAYLKALMALFIRASGMKMCNMESAWRLGLIKANMRASISKARSMDKENSLGQTGLNTWVNLKTMTFVGTDTTPGRTVAPIKALGRTTRWMDKASTLGPMAASTKVNSKWIKRMVMAL